MFAINLNKVISIKYEKEILESEIDDLDFLTARSPQPNRVILKMDLNNEYQDPNVSLDFETAEEAIAYFNTITEEHTIFLKL